VADLPRQSMSDPQYGYHDVSANPFWLKLINLIESCAGQQATVSHGINPRVQTQTTDLEEQAKTRDYESRSTSRPSKRESYHSYDRALRVGL
jgi:hypothetical protein